MKCPSCGAEVGSGKFCEYCGSQLSSEMLKEQERVNRQGCPKCGSTNVSFRRENQGEIHEKKQKVVIHATVGLCNDCGYTWTTTETAKKRKTWLWVLGWIFIFPLPLTLILVKKKGMKPAIKYGIIAAAWIVYLIFGLSGNKNSDSTQPSITEPVEQSSIVTSVAEPVETTITETVAQLEDKTQPTTVTTTKVATTPTTKPTTTKPATTKPTTTKATTTKPTTAKEESTVYYSTNDRETVKQGNSGVYAYSGDSNPNLYYIIDFDKGYVYRFTDDESNSCDRVKIDSGNLNDVLIFTYHDGATKWSNGLHFKWKNQPNHLVLQDEDGFEWDFTPANLSSALKIRDQKKMIDY